MSTTITTQPPTLILAKQPVGFTAHTSDAGSPMRIKANISGSTDGDSVAVDGSGNATFELSDYLQGLITERYKTDDTPVVYTNNPYPVSVEFHSLAGTPPVQTSEVESGVFYLLDGFVPKPRRKALYANYGSLWFYLYSKTSPLSWFPEAENKKISSTQKEFINYLQVFSQDPVDIFVMQRIFFTDGTSVNMMPPTPAVSGVANMKMVYIPTGYTQIGLAALLAANYLDKTLDHYVISVLIDGLPAQVSQGYVLDDQVNENTRLLYIRNSFGLLEIVRCTGQGEQTNELKIEVARTDGHILPDKISWKYEKSDVVKANTGFLTKAQMQWLSDMDFTEAYELISDVLHPIVFNDLKLPVVHDGEYQYSADLEYEYAYNEITEVD